MHGHTSMRRLRPEHHDPTPHPIANRHPLPWFAVAIVAGFAALVLG